MRDVFWARGYEGTSIADLVAATGVLSGSLHAGFGTESDLFAAALEAYDEPFEGAMAVEGRGRERLCRYIDLLFDRVVADPDARGCFVVSSAGELDRHSADNRRALRTRLARMEAFVAERLAEDGIDDDRAAAFFGAVVALLTLARCGASRRTLEGVRDRAKRTLREG